MSQSFRCDGCREFFSGSPAFEGIAQGRTVSRGGSDYYRPKHHGGVDDYNPVGEPPEDMEVEWPEALIQSKSFCLCATCFTENLLPAVHETIHDKEERDDS